MAKNKPKINPKKQMSQAEIADGLTKGDPFFDFVAGKMMPLFIYITRYELAPPIFAFNISIIMHHIPENQVSAKGQIRFLPIGGMVPFESKERWANSPENIELLKTELNRMADSWAKFEGIVVVGETTVLEIAVGEDVDSVVQRLADTDYFRVGEVVIN